MEKVFLTEHIHPDAVAYLRENFEVVQGTSTESGEIIRQAQGCSAILIRSAKITAEIMDAIPTLKVVAKHGMGVDNIAVDHATEKGILVVNAPFSNLNAVAEHIVMLLLALSKRTVQMDQLTRAGQFKERNTYKTIELKGATVGIIGMGKISRLVVKKLSGFEMNILATDPYVKQADVEGLGITMATPEELYAKSDFVIVHTSLFPSTFHLVGAESATSAGRVTTTCAPTGRWSAPTGTGRASLPSMWRCPSGMCTRSRRTCPWRRLRWRSRRPPPCTR